jgi:FAD/FMN-containing dehydrogenase
MLDMSLMRGVWVDAKRKVAHAQAGCLLGDVDRETQVHGLAAILGFVSLTGIAGLTLGGGFGYLTRRWGWTSDNVVGMDVVTADARLVRASSGENADLFWGLLGGGGNFGVVTGIDYMLYPVGPEVVGGVVAWPASAASQVLELYRTLAEKAPPELTLIALMRLAPPAPWLPKDTHGKPIVALLACYSGKPEEGEKAVAPIKSFGNPIGDARAPAVRADAVLLDATQPKGLLLLEERVPFGRRTRLCSRSSSMCQNPIASLGRDPVPNWGCSQPTRRVPLPRRQPPGALRAQHNTVEQADEDSQLERHARRGTTCAASRPAARTSTS